MGEGVSVHFHSVLLPFCISHLSINFYWLITQSIMLHLHSVLSGSSAPDWLGGLGEAGRGGVRGLGGPSVGGEEDWPMGGAYGSRGGP